MSYLMNMFAKFPFHLSPDEGGGGGQVDDVDNDVNVDDDYSDDDGGEEPDLRKELESMIDNKLKGVTNSSKIQRAIEEQLGPVSETLEGLQEILDEIDEYDEDDYDYDYEDDDYEDDDWDLEIDDDLDKSTRSHLEKLRQSFERKLQDKESVTESRIQQLEEELEDARLREEAAEELALLSRRDREIIKALDGKVINNEGALTWFRDKIFYDEDSDKFVFVPDENDEETYYPVSELDNYVPNWLKSAKGNAGSGTSGRKSGETATEATLNSEISNLQRQVEKLQETASATGADDDTIKYINAKRELDLKRKELKELKNT